MNQPNISPDPAQVTATNKAFQDILKTVTLTDGQLEKISSVMKKINKQAEDSGDSFDDWLSTSEDLSDELKGVSSEFNDIYRQQKRLVATGRMSIKDMGKYNDQIKKLKNRYKDLKKRNPFTAEGVKAQKEGIRKIRVEQQSLIAGMNKGYRTEKFTKGFGALGNMFKSLKSPDGLKKAAEDAQILGDELDVSGEGMKGIGKAGGAALKGLGGALGGIGKMMSGPAGWIAMGVNGIVQLGLAADDFAKNANKRFARVRGPNIMTVDVKKQFKQFNDELYSAAKNISVGLNAAQVGEFVEALTSAGTHLDVLNTGFTNYRDAVYVAAKASKTLGAELPMVASMMGTLINEFRLNIDQIDDLFVQMGFDAQKAGMSTDKFWSAIENATTGLMFYGVSMSAASKEMSNFAKSQTMGMQDASALTTEYNQAFLKMSLENKAAFIDLVKSTTGGGRAINDAFGKIKSEWSEKAQAIQYKIDLKQQEVQTPEVVEELAKLRNEQSAAQSKASMASDAMNKNSVAQAPYLPMLADNAMQLTSLLVKGQVGSWSKLQGENLIIAQQIAKATGMSEDLVMKTMGYAKGIDNKFKTELGLSEMNVKGDKSLLDRLQSIDGTGAKGQKKLGEVTDLLDIVQTFAKEGNINSADGSEATTDLANTLEKNLGLMPDVSQDLAKMVSLDKKGAFTQKLIDIMKKGYKGDKKEAEALLSSFNSSDVTQNELNDTATMQFGVSEDMKKRADDTFKEINKQTLSYKDMVGIAKDEVQWRLSAMVMYSGINDGVNNLVGMFKDKWGVMTETQKVANQWLIRNVGLQEDEVKEGKLTRKAQDRLLKETQQGMIEANTAQAGLAIAMGELKTAGKAKPGVGQIDSIGASISKLQKSSASLFNKSEKGTITDSEKLVLGAQQKAIEKLSEAKKALELNAKVSAAAEKGGAGIQQIPDIDLQIGELQKAIEQGALVGQDRSEERGQLQALQDMKKKISGAATNAELKKILSTDKTNAASLEVDTEKQMKIAAEDYKKSEEQLKQLTSLNSVNAKISEYQKALVMSNKDAKKALASSIAADVISGGADLGEAFAEAGMSSEEDQKAIIAESPVLQAAGSVKLAEQRGGAATRESMKKAQAAQTGIKSYATLTSPKTVTAPGVMKLDPGEVILPKGYDIKTLSAPNLGGGTIGGGGQGKTFNVTINAYTRDIAEKIRNEVQKIVMTQ